MDIKKAFDKIQTSFMMKEKQLLKLGLEENFSKLIKYFYRNSTINILPNNETLNAFPLESRNWQGCLFSSLPFNIVLEALARLLGKKMK